MKVIAAIEADFERGAMGTRSRLRDDLLGETVLRRTLKRVLECKRLASVHLIVDMKEESLAREAASGLAVRVEVHKAGPPPWQAYVASARKWAMDAWRGGIGGMMVHDEALNPWVLEALTRREGANGVAAVPAAAAIIDPKLLDELIAHFEKVYEDVRMAFTQSPPGWSAAVYAPELLADLAKTVQPPGRVMSYRPSEPRRDMILQPCYYSVEPTISRASGRLIVDTGAAYERVRRILEKGVDGPAALASLGRGEKTNPDTFFPGEVEIELTTEDPLPATRLRPRGEAVGQRGPMDEEVFARLVGELAGRDDVRVVLGGFGDPLTHPKWPALVRRCRAAGVFGLAVRTPAVNLDEDGVAALVENQVDVLNVLLDAATAGTYARVHGADCFDRVKANVERVLAAHQRTKQSRPLIVCEMTKTRETLGEMEAFYDYWINRTGAAVIVGPSSYAGRWTDLAVMQMAPPARFACGRVFERAMVLADGRMTVCDQDFRGEYAVGSVANGSLGELWRGERMHAVRGAERAGRHDGMPLCAACEEWHRP